MNKPHCDDCVYLCDSHPYRMFYCAVAESGSPYLYRASADGRVRAGRWELDRIHELDKTIYRHYRKAMVEAVRLGLVDKCLADSSTMGRPER
jgi:hypothetical protein